MSDRRERLEVHVRVMIPEDAAWVVAADRAAATALAPAQGWEEDKLEAELVEQLWASDQRFAWAIVVAGTPSGFALVTEIASGDAQIMIRIAPRARGRGVGREVLRQLADHHFSEHAGLLRLSGRAHEQNVPMQRVFTAAGFRIAARHRHSFEQPDGRYADEWGYTLTRGDWSEGRHRADPAGYHLHGLTFELDETVEGSPARGLRLQVDQKGRRVLARYEANRVADGELAGVIVADLLRYHWTHVAEYREGVRDATGRGRSRIQRRRDGRLELVDEWSNDDGTHGKRVLVQRHREDGS